MDCEARRKRLLEGRQVDGFLVFDLDRTMPSQMDRPNMQYLSGYSGEGALLITNEATVIITDSRYLEQAKQEVPELPLVHAELKYYKELAQEIGKRGLKRIGYAAWRTTDYVLGRLSELPGPRKLFDLHVKRYADGRFRSRWKRAGEFPSNVGDGHALAG